MDATATPTPTRYLTWLPYWAVLQTDLRQTLRSWVYRIWVLAVVVAAGGYLMYRVGTYREAGIVQPASALLAEVLRGTLLGSVALVVVLAVSSIAAERGTLADSILSRGISRHQYFLAKWHARLVVIVTTFLLMGAGVLVAGHFLLHQDLSLSGSLLALGVVAAVLTAVASCGVAVGALAPTPMLGVTILWVALYGSAFLLSLLPALVPVPLPSPERMLARLPAMLRGAYADTAAMGEIVLTALAVSVASAVVGLIGFARRDV
jgi:hypothetical protein